MAGEHDQSTASTGDPGIAGDAGAGRPGEGGDLIGSTIAGRYRILGQIGEGGFGLVYEAEQVRPIRRRVALKILKPGMDSKAVLARFEAERQALAVMDHPCVAKVLDAGTVDDDCPGRGLPFFVMELVRGSPITEYCDRQRLTITQRLNLFARVSDAIQHAHTKAIIHRDIKPSNILVETPGSRASGGEPTPKVIDFGIAKAMAQKLTEKTMFTERGQMIGTPEYMSPEQAEMSGEDIDTRSDVYSLGVLLYELLTGERPFDLRAAALIEIQRVIREVEPPKPSTRLTGQSETGSRVAECRRTDPRSLSGTLKRELEWIPLRALRKDRSERYGSAADLGDDVRRYLRGEALEAGPPSAGYRLRKFVRRNQGPVAAVLALFAVLVLGVAGTGYGLRMARIEAEKVRKTQREATGELLSLARSGANILGPDQIGAIARGAGLDIRFIDTREHADDIKHMGLEIPSGYGDYSAVLVPRVHSSTATRDPSDGISSLAAFANEVVVELGDAVREATLAAEAAELASRTIEYNSYVANVQMAQASLDMHLFERVFLRLDDASTSFRSWEWFWLSARSDTSLLSLSAHAPVASAAFSPDGTRIVTASYNKTARVWDTVNGDCLAELAGHAGIVIFASFSADGMRIVTTSDDRTARVWDAVTGTMISELTANNEEVLSASFSQVGARVVTATPDGAARVWDADSGTTIAELIGHAWPVSHAAMSTNGTRIVTASDDRTVRVWDAVTGASIADLTEYTGGFLSGSFSPDGTRIVTTSDDGTVRIWNAATGASIAELAGHAGVAVSASFSPDGTRVVTAALDTTARVWNAATGESVTELTGHTGWVVDASFNPDGTRVVTASSDGTSRVWDSATGESLAELTGHKARTRSASFSPDGTRIVTASFDGTARVWDAELGSSKAEINRQAGIWSASFSPDGRRIVLAGTSAQIWDAETGESVGMFAGDGRKIRTASFSPDETRVVTASVDGTSRVWDAATGAALAELVGHTKAIVSVSFSTDGVWVVTASDDNTARVWDASTGAAIAELAGHTGGVLSASFSSDGGRVVTASSDTTARLWDSATGKSLAILTGHTSEVMSASFSPDGKRIATASLDRTARIWDAATEMALAELKGHTEAVFSVSFSPDGTRIATASMDRTARVWDATTGVSLADLTGHTSIVHSASFSPDGTRIVTASMIGGFRIWDAVPYRVRYAERQTNARGEDGSAIVKAWMDESGFSTPPAPPPPGVLQN